MMFTFKKKKKYKCEYCGFPMNKGIQFNGEMYCSLDCLINKHKDKKRRKGNRG